MAQQVSNTIVVIFSVLGVNLCPIEDSIKRVLRGRAGIRSVIVNYYMNRIYVEFDPSRVAAEEIMHLVKLTTRADRVESIETKQR